MRYRILNYTNLFYNAPSRGSYFRANAFVVDSLLRNSQTENAINLHTATLKKAPLAIHCEHCDLQFKDLYSLELHTLRWGHTKKRGDFCAFHLDEKVYLCTHCGDKFTTVAYKDKHEREVCRNRADENSEEALTEDPEPVVLEELVHVYDGVEFAYILTEEGERIRCLFPGCNTALKNNRPDLRVHIQYCHPSSRDWICEDPDCDKAYSTKRLRARHYKNVHLIKSSERERKHACMYEGCGKAFLTTTHLTRTNTHWGETVQV